MTASAAAAAPPDVGDGRVLLITGASTGIGAATARQALSAGYRVVLAARAEDKVAALARELGGPDRALAMPCDVTDWGQVRALVDRAVAAFGGIDVAFANAGLRTWGAGFLGGDDDPEGWRQMILTNVYGTAATARCVLPALVARRGHLVLTGSVAGRVAFPGAPYSATKFAVTAMGWGLRQELRGTGVRVTVVEPGRVDTPFFDDPAGRSHRPDDAPALHPDDVARAVLFAVSQPPSVDLNELLIRPVGQEV